MGAEIGVLEPDSLGASPEAPRVQLLEAAPALLQCALRPSKRRGEGGQPGSPEPLAAACAAQGKGEGAGFRG
eukprot:8045677-Alexandrium_andersonii.AAC.1